MIILGFLQFLFVFAITIYELKKKSPVVFLWAVLLIMFGIPHFLSVASGEIEYSKEVMNTASIFVLLFSLIFFISRYLIGKPFNQTKHKDRTEVIRKKEIIISNTKDRNNIIILVIILTIIVIYQIYTNIQSVGGIGNISWGNLREANEDRDYVDFSSITRILYFLFSGILLYLFINNRKKSFLGVAILILFRTFMGGNRINITPLLAAIVSIIILNIKNIRIKHIIVFGILGLFAIYFIYSLRVFRHYGTIENFVENFNWSDFNSRVLLYLRTDNGELGLRTHFYYFIDNNNSFQNFNKGHTYIRMILMPIPTRFSFGLKPTDFAHSMGSAVGMAKGGSVHPTLFGDVYANFGNLGFFMGIFWALFAYVGDRIIIKSPSSIKKSLLFMLYSSMYIIIARGSVYNGFFYIGWGVIFIYISNIMNRITITPQNNHSTFISDLNRRRN